MPIFVVMAAFYNSGTCDNTPRHKMFSVEAEDARAVPGVVRSHEFDYHFWNRGKTSCLIMTVTPLTQIVKDCLVRPQKSRQVTPSQKSGRHGCSPQSRKQGPVYRSSPTYLVDIANMPSRRRSRKRQRPSQ